MIAGQLFGIDVIVSHMLRPEAPTPGEDARRIVRHGLADVLKWLGEDPGPLPGETTTAMYLAKTHGGMLGGRLLMSHELYEELSCQALIGPREQLGFAPPAKALLDPLFKGRHEFLCRYEQFDVPVVMPACLVKVTGLRQKEWLR